MSGWLRPTELKLTAQQVIPAWFASIALFLCSGRGENRRPARHFGPDKTIERRRVALGLGGDRAAELGQGLANGRLIERLVEGIGKFGDHLGRNALGSKQPGPDAHFI